jgi:BCD family chlorophyll transporter-like MFS transporter
LRLALFQVSVGMTLVLLVGTLNRVMIVELGVSTSLVAIMLALPLVFAPFRALVGHRSDTHRSELGWRRVPFIWKGTLLQFGGFSIMPFALLVLAGRGEAAYAPVWIGQFAAAVSFLLVGAGAHIVQTAGLALATDLTPEESHPRVVGLMYTVLLLGMLVASLLFGAALRDFSPGRLVQVIQGAALSALVLNTISMWKQEPRRHRLRDSPSTPDPTFQESWAHFSRGAHARRHLVIVGLGTLGFGMADVLLEPFGGQILDLTVAVTTSLTAVFAFGGLLGFGWASRVLGDGGDANRVALQGAAIGLPAFALVMLAAPMQQTWLFVFGNLLIGFGGAAFGHGTLTATMNRAPRGQTGLALGAWGAVQATAVGVAMAASGVIRDLVNAAAGSVDFLTRWAGASSGYVAVYSLEIALLAVTVVVTLPLTRSDGGRQQGRSGDSLAAAPELAEPNV